MKGRYEVRYSAIARAGGWAFLAIILCWLILPLIIWIIYCVKTNYDYDVIENGKIKRYRGMIAKSESTVVLTNVLSVSIDVTFMGRILNYGNVRTNCVGTHSDLHFLGVKDPESLKYFLEKLAAKKEEIKQIVTE